VGDNRAPIIDSPKSIQILEDADNVSLNITLPSDPENGLMTVKVIGIPGQGEVLNGSTGNALSINDVLTINQLTDLIFKASTNFVGDAGKFEYIVTDDGSVSSNSYVGFLIEAVNDAPTFGPDAIQNVEFSGSLTTVNLSIATPSDAEETILTVSVVELPAYGAILNSQGGVIVVGDILNVSDLSGIQYSLSTNINGPVGELILEATDSLGLSGQWKLMIEVSGEASLSSGTSGADQLFGSVDVDKIFALGGDDQILSNAGNDVIYAGSGNDIVYAGKGNDEIYGGGGDDYIDGYDPNNTGPTANFSASPTTVPVGATVTFTDLSTPSGSITSWQWDFGGTAATPATSTSSGPIDVTYNTPGTYTVTLIVSDGTDYDTLVRTDYITVTDTANSNTLDADFTADNTTIFVGLFY
jgi:hypothetical protein